MCTAIITAIMAPDLFQGSIFFLSCSSALWVWTTGLECECDYLWVNSCKPGNVRVWEYECTLYPYCVCKILYGICVYVVYYSLLPVQKCICIR